MTFRYPGTLQEGTVTKVDVSSSSGPSARAALRLDESNGIILSKYDLNVSVTDHNLDQVVPEVDQLIRR